MTQSQSPPQLPGNPSTQGSYLETPAVAKAPGQRLTVLILTLIAGFLSLGIGGCTAAVGEGIAKFGEDLSEFDQKFADGRNSAKLRGDANEVRASSGMQFGLAFLEMILGIGGGILAYLKFDNRAAINIAGKNIKHLTLAGVALILAAVLSLSNCLAFVTAGLLNTIAAILTLLRSHSLN